MPVLVLSAVAATLIFALQTKSQPILPDPNAPPISPQAPASSTAMPVPGTEAANPSAEPSATTPAAEVEPTPTAPTQPAAQERPPVSNSGATIEGTEAGTQPGATAPTVGTAATAASPDDSTAAAAEQLYAVSDQTWADSQKINYRKITAIKWPSAFLGVSDLREKYKEVWDSRDVEMFKKIFNEYCLSYAALYGAQVEKEWSLEAGLLSLDRVCEELKVQADTATAADSYLFAYPNALIMKKFDQAVYEFYSSPAFKINAQMGKLATQAQAAVAAEPVVTAEPNEDSLFSMLGIPGAFIPLVTDLLLLLSLMLNFFLLYKVFKKQ